MVRQQKCIYRVAHFAEWAQSKERKGSNFAALRNEAVVRQAQRAKRPQSIDLALAIWQPYVKSQYRVSHLLKHKGLFLPTAVTSK